MSQIQNFRNFILEDPCPSQISQILLFCFAGSLIARAESQATFPVVNYNRLLSVNFIIT